MGLGAVEGGVGLGAVDQGGGDLGAVCGDSSLTYALVCV